MIRVRLALTLLATAVAGFAPGAPAAGIDLASSRLVDLTHPFDERTLYWPTSPTTFKLERLSYGMTPGGWFYAANALCAPEHGGTHLDAPIHFAEGKETTDQVPLERLGTPGAARALRKVADVPWLRALDPEEWTIHQMDSWRAGAGLVPLVEGSGRLVRQIPAAGSAVPKGSTVRLVFEPAS